MTNNNSTDGENTGQKGRLSKLITWLTRTIAGVTSLIAAIAGLIAAYNQLKPKPPVEKPKPPVEKLKPQCKIEVKHIDIPNEASLTEWNISKIAISGTAQHCDDKQIGLYVMFSRDNSNMFNQLEPPAGYEECQGGTLKVRSREYKDCWSKKLPINPGEDGKWEWPNIPTPKLSVRMPTMRKESKVTINFTVREYDSHNEILETPKEVTIIGNPATK